MVALGKAIYLSAPSSPRGDVRSCRLACRYVGAWNSDSYPHNLSATTRIRRPRCAASPSARVLQPYPAPFLAGQYLPVDNGVPSGPVVPLHTQFALTSRDPAETPWRRSSQHHSPPPPTVAAALLETLGFARLSMLAQLLWLFLCARFVHTGPFIKLGYRIGNHLFHFVDCSPPGASL